MPFLFATHIQIISKIYLYSLQRESWKCSLLPVSAVTVLGVCWSHLGNCLVPGFSSPFLSYFCSPSSPQNSQNHLNEWHQALFQSIQTPLTIFRITFFLVFALFFLTFFNFSIFMCMCMHVYVCAYLHVWGYVWGCMCTGVYVHVCIAHVCAWVCWMCVCSRVHMWRPKADVYSHPPSFFHVIHSGRASQANLGLVLLASLLGWPLSLLSQTGITGMLPSPPSIYVGPGDLNSGFHA